MEISGQLHSPAALSLVTNPRYTALDTWEEENIIAPAWNRTRFLAWYPWTSHHTVYTTASCTMGTGSFPG
jgi:hypothetical protein